ncbi:MAG: TonB-dependent receptor [FCB group bacterium]|nr:TonB-dependent receptor [FCB group bacterium]
MESMRITFTITVFLLQFAFSQNIFRAIINDKETGQPLIGVNVMVKELGIGGISDSTGLAEIRNIPDGKHTIEFSYIGYETYRLRVSFPLPNKNHIKTIRLEPRALELAGITVTTTRTNSRIEDSPVRVEVLGRDEVNEEISIKPGNISKLLGETSGIQIQQTSLTSGNVSFRIQGLPGKYTQLLKDGFPIYSGFSSGLSLLQIPPLDLEQVEIIKGSSSTLYGGGAIAGIVNLVTKTPSEIPEWSVLINQTQKDGRDISSYYSRKHDRIGVTVLASRSTQKAVDVDNDGFTDLPRFSQFTFNPRIFYDFNNSTSFTGSITASGDDREGGDIQAIEKGPSSGHTFVEKNKTARYISQVTLEKKFASGGNLLFKNSFSLFKRDISEPDKKFYENQLSGYSELSGLIKTGKHNIVAGLNFNNDAYSTDKTADSTVQKKKEFTTGVFAQDDWNLSEKAILQTGLRSDYHNEYGWFILPRVSLLYKVTNQIYVRTGVGMGYKTPSIMTDETEAGAYDYVLPITGNIKAESSQGMNVDINYQTILWGNISLTMNQAFYYTQVNHALIPQPDLLSRGILAYQNAAAPIETRGFDTNIYFAHDNLTLFMDYTYTDARKIYDRTNSYMSLTPRQKFFMTFAFEEENAWRTGMEVFYTGKQYLEDGTQTRDYWIFGLMAEKMFNRFSIFGNVENLLDIRQTRFEKVVTPPYDNPGFKEIWAPLDGIVANLAVKVQL